jgi:hypothetical protein
VITLAAKIYILCSRLLSLMLNCQVCRVVGGQIFTHLSKTLMPFSVAAGSWDCSLGSKLDPLIAALENEYL